MTATTEPTQYLTTIETTASMAARVKATRLDERLDEIPAELTSALHADRTEQNLERCVAWLEAHPPVPAWLNLDAVVTDECRQKIAIALGYVRRNVDVVRETAMAVRMWTWDFEEAAQGLPEDVYAAVEEATGVSELRRLGGIFAELFTAALEGKPTPEDVLKGLDAIEALLEAQGIEPAEVVPDLYATAEAAQG